MRRDPVKKPYPVFPFPHFGQRILKTGIAVFLCLLIYYLRGYRGQDMPTEAAITAIVCMQPYVRDTRTYAVNRMAGTLIGAFWGLALLFALLIFPALAQHMPLIHAFMAIGVMLSIYSAVLIRKPDASGLAAIVFLCVVIAFPEIEQPLHNTFLRITGVLLGTLIAVAVNVCERLHCLIEPGLVPCNGCGRCRERKLCILNRDLYVAVEIAAEHAVSGRRICGTDVCGCSTDCQKRCGECDCFFCVMFHV